MKGDRPDHLREATGRPGAPPRRAGGSKTAGGTARSDALVWFTAARGVLTEVYYPRIDSPCTRELYCLVTGPGGYRSDERAEAEHRVEWLAEGVPGFVVTSTCASGRCRLEKTLITDDLLQDADHLVWSHHPSHTGADGRPRREEHTATGE